MPASDWIGLRSIDLQLHLPKGSAFRAFKMLAPNWTEAAHYRVLHHEQDRELIRALKERGDIYAGSVNAVLLEPARAEELRAHLRAFAIKR